MYGQLEPGTVVGHYRIGELLGSGGMGAVYLAEHLTLRTSVALKVLRPDLAQDPDFRERFLREARSAASLDHPNIVPVYDAGEGGGSLFIAMRYVEGTDLARVLGAEGDLDPARAIAILRQVAEALDEAHRNGLVHRDVKPANILIAGPTATRTGERAYLTDFGLVKPAADPSLTGGGMFIGTRDYVAPELLMSNDADARADQYGLTCVLFQTLTGSVPFPRDFDAAVITAHLAMEPPPVAALHPGLPPALDDVIGRGMAKDRERRFPDCVGLIDAAAAALGVGPPARLDRDASDAAPPAAPPQATRRARPGPRPRPSSLVAAGLALVLVAGATAWFLTRGEPVAVTACGSAAGDLEGRLRADGGTIAFVSDRGGDRDLYRMDVTTASVRQLTTDPGTDGNPTWSPDGSRLAFDSDRDGDFDIYVMSADGSGLERLVGDPGADVSPAWSPDGRSIAFSSTRDGNNEIYVVDVATGEEHRITSNVAHDGQPTWSPDGRSIAFSSDRTGSQEIFVMNADGTVPRNLTRSASTDLKPAWSPDGSSIAFTSDRDGDVDVYLMDPTGTNTRQLTLNDAVDGYPSWSPDGTWLLFDTPVQGATDICALPVEGGGGVDLTSDSAALDAVTSWTSGA
jgi:Tol biopolymer transport system component